MYNNILMLLNLKTFQANVASLCFSSDPILHNKEPRISPSGNEAHLPGTNNDEFITLTLSNNRRNFEEEKIRHETDLKLLADMYTAYNSRGLADNHPLLQHHVTPAHQYQQFTPLSLTSRLQQYIDTDGYYPYPPSSFHHYAQRQGIQIIPMKSLCLKEAIEQIVY